MVDFDGFPTDGLQFLADLRENNDREWFNARKSVYENALVKPAVAFIEALGERLKLISPELRYDTRLNGSGSMMRIYRDVRFSKDKAPYKTNLGIVFWQGNGRKIEMPGFYFHLAPGDVWIGGGLYRFPKQVIDPYRRAVDDPARGEALDAILADVQAAGYRIHGEQYKRVPREYDKAHPRGDLLRYKGLFAGSDNIAIEHVTSPDLVDICFEQCTAVAPLQQWLAALV